jgi:predicted alpha/beta-hydrolase family hydrolase
MNDIFSCFLWRKKEKGNIGPEELRKMERIIRKLMSVPIVIGGGSKGGCMTQITRVLLP